MGFTVSVKSVPSTDGIHSLAGKVYKPETEAKGLLMLVHGMTEHIARYDRLMSDICDEGYVVFGYDHVGHGMTARDDSELGFISEKEGDAVLVGDVSAFASEMKRLYPSKPLCVYGHSMGSFIVRLAAVAYPGLADSYIISGTGGKNGAAGIGLSIANLLCKTKGAKSYSSFIEKLAFGTYNKKTGQKTPYDWLSKDESVTAAYAADKFCTFRFTVSALRDLIAMNINCNKREWFEKFPKNVPVLLMSGSEDPVGNYGQGVKYVYDELKKAGVADVSMKLFEGFRHEPHNDSSYPELLALVKSFISAH